MSDGEIEDFAQDILRRARLRNQVLNPDSSAPSMALGLEAIRKRPATDTTNVLGSTKAPPVLMNESAHTRKPQDIPEALKTIEKEEEPESEEEAEESEDENKVPLPTDSSLRRTLRRLGELYGEEGSMPSPVRDHTIGEKTPDPTPQLLTSDKSGGRRGRLNALANTINGWEDDLTHYCSPTSRFNVSEPRQARKSTLGFAGARTSPTKLNFTTPPQTGSGREAQGFVSNSSKTKLTYEYSEQEFSPVRARSVSPMKKHASLFEQQLGGHCSPSPIGKRAASTSPVRKPAASPVRNMPISSTPISDAGRGRSPSPVKPVNYASTEVDSTPKAKLSVAQKKAMFEVKDPGNTAPVFTQQKDPALLTVAERARLFEQQAFQPGGHVPAPKIGFNKKIALKPFVPSPLSPNKAPGAGTQVSLPKGTVENQRRLFEKALSRSGEEKLEEEAGPAGKAAQANLLPLSAETPPPMFIPPAPPAAVPAPPPLPAAADLSVTFSALASPPRRSRSRSPQKQSMTPNKRSASPSPPRQPSPKAKYPALRNVKRIRVNEPKPGRMYPSLTDIESTETETESEMNPREDNDFDMDYEDEDMDSETSHESGFSLGTHIEQVAKQNTPKRNPHFRPTEDFSTSLACRQIDELIDDALEGQSFSMDTIMEAELNAPASVKPNACSTSVESFGPAAAQESWQVSDELARLNASEDNTLEPLNASEQQISSSDFSSEQSTALETQSSGTVDDCQGPESNVDGVLESSVDMPAASGEVENETGDVCSSFEYSNASSSSNKDGSPVVSSSPLYARRKEASPAPAPLVHTVSFFRKQQGQAITTTPRKVVQDLSSVKLPSPVKPSTSRDSVNEVIKKLEEEMTAQHRSIAQVSKALNLCKATVEFSESKESVECERVLLIATQKRTALLNEIHRLKTEGVLSSKLSVLSPSKQDLGPSCRGNMTLSDVAVRLNPDFVSRAMSGESVYHFVCLAKYRSQLEASSVLVFPSTGPGLSSTSIQDGAWTLAFPNSFTLTSLEPEFAVTLEIHVLQTRKEFLPHEAKYHIKKEAKKLTPRKQKQDSKLSRPFQQSPAGPNAVRTTNFSLCGKLTIDIGTLQRKHWELDGIREEFEGTVSIKIQCNAEGGPEERGFLTMFDDVSGFGAWHRRWCKLTPTDLSYWMYPEDEMENKIPIGSIPLRLCVTTRVGPVQREVCARANTFLLVTTRSPQEKDHDTLTTSCHADYTAVRHLLTADTREERDLWCKQINKALTNLRAWDPHAHSPDDSLFYK